MNVRHTLICVFFLSLCGGDSVSAKLYIFAGAEGGNGTIDCYMMVGTSGRTKFFCKDECEAKDILIKTDEVRAQSGRYSTTYRNNSSGRETLSVTFTHLIKSDSGRYRSGLGKNLVPDSYCDFEVRVLDASLLEDHSRFIQADTEGENITFGCTDTAIKQKFLCKGDCTKEEDIIIETEENRAQNGRHSIEYIEGSALGLHVTITEVTTSDTGWYRCGYGRALSPDSYYDKNILVLSALQDENTGLINAYTVYGRTEGGDVKVKCSYSESWKFFCRDECKEKDVLIETNLDKHQSGRYSIKSRAGSLYVTITQLTKSDSGLYRCGSGTTQSSRSSYEQFKITVVDAKLDGNAPDVTTIYKRAGGNIIVQCSFTNSGDRKYFCKNGCEEKDILVETTGDRVEKDRYSIEFIKGSSPTASLYVGITQLNKSDSGLYQCVLDISLSPDPIRKFNIIVTDPTTSKPPSAFTTPVPSASTLTSTQSDQQLTGTTLSPGVLLSVIVILGIAVIIMGLALMIICIQRNNRPDGLRTRGNSDGTNMEVYDHENCPAVHNHEDSTYQSLNPATMDEDQIYSALTHT